MTSNRLLLTRAWPRLGPVAAALPLLVLSACGGSDSDSVDTPLYKVGGQVSGLQGAGLMLHNNGTDDLRLAPGATQFAFDTALAAGSAYAVTVAQQPEGQSCSVSQGSGTLQADVNNVRIACTDDSSTPGTGEDDGGEGDSGAGDGGNGSQPPEPGPGPDPSPGSGAASDCFNPALTTPGTTYRWHWKTQDGFAVDGSPVSLSMAHDMTVAGGASFAGHSGLLRDHGTLNMVTTAEGMTMTLSGPVTHYARLVNEATGPVILSYGSESSLNMTIPTLGLSGRFDSKTVESPPTENRWFTLQPGQSYQHTSNSVTETTTVMMGQTSSERFSGEESYAVTYLGQTTVTVPAGTFQACRFRGLDGEGSADVYYAVGSGLPLVMNTYDEDLNGYVRLEMQADSHINGVPVRP